MESKVHYQVLVWGGYFCDLIYTGMQEFPRLGAEVYSQGFEFHPGGCFTTVLALNRLGVKTGWASDFGNDTFSQIVLEHARREGFDERLFRHHARPVRRVTSVISYPHDRAFMSFIDPVYPPDAAPIFAGLDVEWLLLSHLYYGKECLQLFQAARDRGMRIFMDCQSIDTSLDESPEIALALGMVEVFAPNQAEALRLTGKVDLDSAVSRLAELTPLVVIKLGEDGALAMSQGKLLRSPAVAVSGVVDTTGAGDCFDAGFLYGLVNGKDLATCLRIANVCGGLSVQAAGVQAAPFEGDVLRLLDSRSEFPE